MAITFFNSLAVDTDVLYVDAINDRVGIGTDTPSTKLEVVGTDGNFQTTGHQIFLTKDGVNQIYTNSGASPDVSQLALGTNNTERVRIDSSGRVGIGTTGPLHNLQVGDGSTGAKSMAVSSGTLSALYLINPSSTAQSVVGFGDSQFATINTRGRILYQNSTTAASNYMQFTVAFNEIMRLTDSNVGIGTTDPTQKLDVAGNIVIPQGKFLSFRRGSVDNAILWQGDGTFGSADQLYLRQPNNNNLHFQTNGGNTRMLITGSGNVGIGTASPDRSLVINHASDTRVKLQVNGTDTAQIQTLANQARYHALGSSTPLQFWTNGAERARIDTSGNVGIGTTSPSQKLHVSGNVTADRYYGNGNTTHYVDPNNTTQAAYFAGDIRITDSGTATIKLDSTSIYPGSAIIATKNGSESPSRGELSWYENPGIQGSQWIARVTNSPYTASSILLPTSTSRDFEVVVYGTERFRVDSSTGNFGIGTTSPDVALDVNGNTGIKVQNLGDVVFEAEPNTGTFSLGDVGGVGGTAYITGDNTNIDFFGDGDVRFQNDGNVGIGTTSPSTKLEVGDCESSTNISDGNIAVKTNTNNTAIVIQEASGAEQWGLGVNADGDFIFTDSGTERIRFDDGTGNVGIATTSPSSKLQVNGAVQVADDTDTASASKVGALRYRTSGNNSYVDMCMQTGASTYAWINIVQNSW